MTASVLRDTLETNTDTEVSRRRKETLKKLEAEYFENTWTELIIKVNNSASSNESNISKLIGWYEL